MKRAFRHLARFGLLGLALTLGLQSTLGLQAEPTVPRESVRWHYERALALDAQDQPGRALAALYRALDAADERRRELQRAIKATLPAADRAALEQLERTAYDRRLAGSPAQRQARQAVAAEFERLAGARLEPPQLAEWQALSLRTVECRYLMARLYWRGDRAADVVLALSSVVDAPGLSDHFPAWLLLARAYGRLGAWERALPSLERLAAAAGVSNPEAQRALKFLKDAAARRSTPPDQARAQEALQTAVTAIESACLASPDIYRALTLGRGLQDPVAYLELAHLCEEEEGERRDEARATLLEAIRARETFFPVAWLALGELDETRAAELEAEGKRADARRACQSAAEAFETAFQQLERLDFQPGRDFDPARLTELQRKIAALRE
ncbi:MAG: hypothetical protein CFK52_09225 [Chloracidobacterium sp. CP2_5A]|nr:MAG: hypothetical protein CFK52_09225 [Chloracidobacterium sp. CP2_5A]